MASQVPTGNAECRTPSAELRTADVGEGQTPNAECRTTDGEDRAQESRPRYSAFRLTPEVAEPIEAAAREAGVEVYHAEFSGRELRVQVESQSGASVRACSEFSHALTTRLDAADFLRRQYTLEVSTPGIERRLYQPQDYAKALNQHVKVLARDGWVEGLLEAIGPNGITLRMQDAMQNPKGRMQNVESPETAGREIAYGEIREAHIRVPDCELFASSTGRDQGLKEPRNQVMHSNPAERNQ
jgi:ribosome maturation factor RimP